MTGSPGSATPRPTLDVLRLPVLGPALRRPGTRLALRATMLAAALAMVLHGFFGSPVPPKNLATILSWVHYRGLLVLALVAAGNLLCTGCPLMLARDLARRVVHPRFHWPRALRHKWIGLGAFVAILFAYELFDLWGEPWWTALLLASAIVTVVTVDGLFRGASFCKHLCPVGQFSFLASTVSPLEVRVRDAAVCGDCTTKDCIRGTPAGTHPPRRGCELGLFQPRKVGNLDCTFCLDCVYACPADNVGIRARTPADELALSGPRSGIGRLARRSDLAAFAIVFTFGAILNAFGMVTPVYAVERWLAGMLGTTREWPVLGIVFVTVLVVAPALLLTAAAAWSRRVTASRERLVAIGRRYAFALVPLGFGVWLAHYSFHFLTGALTVVPVGQALLADAGWPLLGSPDWTLAGLPEHAVQPIAVGAVLLGLVVSLQVAHRLASSEAPARAGAATVPWAGLLVLLAVSALWVLSQPMEMRGTFLAS